MSIDVTYLHGQHVIEINQDDDCVRCPANDHHEHDQDQSSARFDCILQSQFLQRKTVFSKMQLLTSANYEGETQW